MPAAREVLREASQAVGYTISEDEVDEYVTLLERTEGALGVIASLGDYQPTPDFTLVPREDVHFPEKADNPLGAWAWRCKCTHKQPTGDLLKGKTVCVKDNIAMAGVPCLLGTDSFTGWTPQLDATVVSRVLEHGGTVAGKAVCENLSRGTVSITASTGPVHNPLTPPGYNAGGSSSGTAALLASGAVDLGLGCDQGGSIRIPAALCGLYGLKPTVGLVPYTGIASLDASVDFVGPMTRTCMDCAVLLKAIAGVDGLDDRQIAGTPFPANVPDYPALLAATRSEGSGVRGMKIGILKEAVSLPSMSPAIEAKFRAAAAKLADLGAEVTEVSVPLHSAGPAIFSVMTKMANHMGMLGRATGRRQVMLTDLAELKGSPPPYSHAAVAAMSSFSREGLFAGEYCWARHPLAYPRAVNLARKLRDDYDEALRGVDLLIMPATAGAARRLPPSGRDLRPLEYDAVGKGLTDNTCPFNATGHPALAVPIGSVAAEEDEAVKVPVGMQIVGRFWDEPGLLRAAYAFEGAVDWREF